MKYRTKVRELEAIRFDGTNRDEINNLTGLQFEVMKTMTGEEIKAVIHGHIGSDGLEFDADLQRILYHCDGNDEFALKLFEAFCENWLEVMQNLNKVMEGQNGG